MWRTSPRNYWRRGRTNRKSWRSSRRSLCDKSPSLRRPTCEPAHVGDHTTSMNSNRLAPLLCLILGSSFHSYHSMIIHHRLHRLHLSFILSLLSIVHLKLPTRFKNQDCYPHLADTTVILDSYYRFFPIRTQHPLNTPTSKFPYCLYTNLSINFCPTSLPTTYS